MAVCGGSTQQTPPSCPEELLFPATQENTPKMRKWLLDRYAASTFNTCPHHPLQDMTGPPLAIRVEAGVQTAVTNCPVRVPVHWHEEVRQQLECGEALGIIEKVPPNTPVTWLHNMVVTPKSDGSPRRTVNLQPLNRVSVLETHHTMPPAKQACSVPRNQVKTVMDAWNSYHSHSVWRTGTQLPSSQKRAGIDTAGHRWVS